jgi:hypothetical protein
MKSEVLEATNIDMHWSAILAGGFTAFGCWMFLYALGGAIGGGAAVRGQPDSWTAIYTLVSPIIALFLGGLICARSRGIHSRAGGALHGIVVWGFTMVIGAIIFTLFGGLAMARANGNSNLPMGYLWAVAGSILGSLIASILGSSATSSRVKESRQVRETFTPTPNVRT